ncbi:hypothetical protein OC845_001220 [Tilletia horrida]|nr:hypothetical protein OC845_001220 [Tilletia horrida]
MTMSSVEQYLYSNDLEAGGSGTSAAYPYNSEASTSANTSAGCSAMLLLPSGTTPVAPSPFSSSFDIPPLPAMMPPSDDAFTHEHVFEPEAPAPEAHTSRIMTEIPKRAQVRRACLPCKKACKKCDEIRPCSRCVRLGHGLDVCVDVARKARAKGVKRGKYKPRKGKAAILGSETGTGSVTSTGSDVGALDGEDDDGEFMGDGSEHDVDMLAYLKAAGFSGMAEAGFALEQATSDQQQQQQQHEQNDQQQHPLHQHLHPNDEFLQHQDLQQHLDDTQNQLHHHHLLDPDAFHHHPVLDDDDEDSRQANEAAAAAVAAAAAAVAAASAREEEENEARAAQELEEQQQAALQVKDQEEAAFHVKQDDDR